MSAPTFCRDHRCRAQIVFVRTRDGRNMPCEVAELNVWLPLSVDGAPSARDVAAGEAVRVITDGGDTLTAWRSKPLFPAEPIGGHEPHFIKCPGAREFRKARPR